MEDFYISTEKERLNIAKIHREIKDSYWGDYRTFEMTTATIDHSICFGVYTHQGEQIGFARLLTDRVVFAYLMDVMIFDPYKGMGIGKKLMQHIMCHPMVDGVLTVALKTKDAHGLYEDFGFKSIGDSPVWMAIDNAKLD
ncbi:GNAT family N-acetyltransferase [Allomuricauda sp. SCSIO 65647]|uniref:GNAT family N-acetyltransferase n=1 Tax=Allomuricauda sp. SCSIO 65647 TaxID=2908843 RepID=UPI001F38C1FF|nr:GNAT family N-acetyltransferase [Muricauda sp. SCSIO 65647]UJH67248.1 GNAT family N-acetyltransferase [Muricauda sp. SCSIO 65647]